MISKKLWPLYSGVATIAFAATALAAQTEASKKYSLNQLIDFQITLAERQVTAVAEAMPAENYDFVPSGAGFKGARSFAAQIRHIAATNCASWRAASSTKCSVHVRTSDGPADIVTKPQLLAFLKESFTVGHQAAKALTPENLSDNLPNEEGGSAARLFLLTEGAAHDFNHYGQLVEYLRMNQIIPPASR